MNRNLRYACITSIFCVLSLLSYNETNAQIWKKIKDKANKLINTITNNGDSTSAKETDSQINHNEASINESEPGASFNKKELPFFSIRQDFADYITGSGRVPVCIRSVQKFNSDKNEICTFSETYSDRNHLTDPYDYVYARSAGHCDLDILQVSKIFFKNFELSFPGIIRDLAVQDDKSIRELRLNHQYRFFGNENVRSGYTSFEYLSKCKLLNNYFVRFDAVSPEKDLNGSLTIGVFKDDCDDVYLFVQSKGSHNRHKGYDNYEITLSGNMGVWKAMAERLEAALTKHCYEITGKNTPGDVHFIGEKLNGGIVFSLDATKKQGLIVTPKDLTDEYGAESWDDANDLAKNYVSSDNKIGWRLPSLKELGLLCRMKEQIGGLQGNTYWSGTRATMGTGMASVSTLSCGDAGAGTPENIRGLSVRAVKEFNETNEDYLGASISWYTKLPDCPCKYSEAQKLSKTLNPSGTWSDCGLANQSFHYGSTYEVRWFPSIKGNPGQQCNYDANGSLITGGLAAGSPDRVSPLDCILSTKTLDHYCNDVLPWGNLTYLGFCSKTATVPCWQYLRDWPANNTLACNTNIVTSIFNVINGVDNLKKMIGNMTCEQATLLIKSAKESVPPTIDASLRNYIIGMSVNLSTHQCKTKLQQWKSKISCVKNPILCSVMNTAINNL